MTRIVKMGGLGVIIEYSSLSQESDKLSCSGIYLSSGWILTHGTIVIDILKSEKAGPVLEELKIKGFSISCEDSPLQSLLESTGSSFQVMLDERNHRNVTQSVQSDSVSCEVLPESSNAQDAKTLKLKHFNHHRREAKNHLQTPLASAAETKSYFCHPAQVFMLFNQPGIARSLASMMPASQGWRLNEEKEGEAIDLDLETLIVSSFALLKVSPQKNNFSKLRNETSFEKLSLLVEKIIPFTGVASKGADVYIESSPFGSLSPGVFLNSLSKGIISNVAGFQKDICLTDARCIMGAEGAPVYVTSDGKVSLCGMVISPFCWKQGEWLGLSLLAAIRPLLMSLLLSLRHCSQANLRNIDSILEKKDIYHTHANKSKTSSENKTVGSLESAFHNLRTEDVSKILDDAVVGISCGGGWGSGIVINSSPGIVLTCAHVIEPSWSGVVDIITSNGSRVRGKVIYHTYPSCFKEKRTNDDDKQSVSMWDLAVVATSSTLPRALPLSTQLPAKGSPVMVAGHGIFSPTCLSSPTLVHGIISKIISVDVHNLSYTTPDGDSIDCWRAYMDTQKIVDIAPVSSSDAKRNAEQERTGKQHHNSRYVNLGGDENGLVPVMIQTTCSVYAGNSGGPVVCYDPKHGLQVVGVMICNTKDLANKATFPNINLAVPSSAISGIISAYLETGDKMLLNFLGVECATASQLWTLGFTPQSNL